MFENEEKAERAILCGVHTGSLDTLNDTTNQTIEELAELAKTAGAEVVGTLVQNRPSPDNALYLGEGKLDELKCAAAELEANVVIFDDELSPVQVKNISDYLDMKVLDRTTLILDIFADRAQTKEGKIQVELAQLRYMLPRLVGMGSALSRLGGGIGTRGPGETKLETDRRHIRRRIEALEGEIGEIEKHRELLRKRRKKDNQLTAALVGYTNAGKSTIMNLLTDANVYAENKLFATLDPTKRSLTLEDSRTIMLIDTVGFIRKLPHHLIKAFKSTLEEAAVSDVLIHVIDASNPEYLSHIKVAQEILEQIGAAEKPTVAVLNKADAVKDKTLIVKSVPGAAATVCMSAKTGIGTDDFLKALGDILPGKKQKCRFLVPYSDGGVIPQLHTDQVVISEEYTEAGTLIEALVDSVCYEKMRKYIKRD